MTTYPINISVDIPTPTSGGVPVPPQGRLTLTSGVAATTSDVAASTIIYYTPNGGEHVPIYDGSNFTMQQFSELSLPLDGNAAHTNYHQNGKNFDLFVFNDEGTVRLGSGPAWATDISRGSGVGTTEEEVHKGLLVNKNAITLRHGPASGETVMVPARCATRVGGFRASANGQTDSSKARQLLSNDYNQVPRILAMTDATASWPYSSTTTRQARGSSANKVEVFISSGGVELVVDLQVIMQNSTATVRNCNFGIGIDTATVLTDYTVLSASNSGFSVHSQRYRGYPGIGYHYATWLEQGAGVDTQTWYGSPYSGLKGALLG